MMTPDTLDAEYRAAIFPNRPFGSRPSENEARQWEEMYVLFGQAMLWAQAYEDGMAQVVVAAENRLQLSGLPDAKIKRMSLGNLQQEFARYCHLEPQDRKRMAEVLVARNEIAHSFYRRRMIQLQTAQGRDQVIRELHDAIRLLQQERDQMYWLLSLLTGQPLW